MKIRYVGNKRHTVTFPLPAKTVKAPLGVKDFHDEPNPTFDGKPDPKDETADPRGASIPQTVKVKFDDKGFAEVTKEEWEAIKPHASQQGIVPV